MTVIIDFRYPGCFFRIVKGDGVLVVKGKRKGFKTQIKAPQGKDNERLHCIVWYWLSPKNE